MAKEDPKKEAQSHLKKSNIDGLMHPLDIFKGSLRQAKHLHETSRKNQELFPISILQFRNRHSSGSQKKGVSFEKLPTVVFDD